MRGYAQYHVAKKKHISPYVNLLYEYVWKKLIIL